MADVPNGVMNQDEEMDGVPYLRNAPPPEPVVAPTPEQLLSMAQQLTELRAQVVALSQETNYSYELRAGISALRDIAATAATTAKSVREPKSAEPKVNKPPEFLGETLKYEAFAHALNIVFQSDKRRFLNDATAHHNRIVYCLSYMTGGSALPWARNFLRDYNPETTAVTWEDFEKQLKDKFADPYPRSTAQLKLEAITQEGKMSVDDYINIYEQYEKDSEYNDESLLRFFKRGLNVSIRRAINNLTDVPSTLKTFKEAARKIDRRDRELEADLHAKTNRVPPPPPPPAPRAFYPRTTATTTATGTRTFPPRAATYDSTPIVPRRTFPVPAAPQSGTSSSHAGMDRRDSTGITFGGAGQPMDVDAMRRAGICFHCKKKGHIARDCPDPSARQFNLRSLAEQLTSEDLEELVRIADVVDAEMRANAVAMQDPQNEFDEEGFPDARE